jgi:hypothetical protein
VSLVHATKELGTASRTWRSITKKQEPGPTTTSDSSEDEDDGDHEQTAERSFVGPVLARTNRTTKLREKKKK